VSCGKPHETDCSQVLAEVDSFEPGQVVLDMVYTEEPSALLAAAAAAGATTVDGLEMLVQQGALSLRIWTGEEPSIEAMRTAVRR